MDNVCTHFTNNTRPIDWTLKTSTERISYTVLGLLLMVLMCSSNGLFIWAYCKTKDLHSLANFMLLNLALADFLVGLSMVYFVVFYVSPSLLQYGILCALRFSAMLFPNMASVWFLVLIGCDRYIAIVNPLHRQMLMTKKTLNICAGLGWSLSFLVGFVGPVLAKKSCYTSCNLLTVLQWYYVALVVIPLYITSVLLMVFFYSRITITVLLHQKKMPVNRARGAAARYKREFAVTKTSFLVVGLYTLCWGPPFLVLAIQAYGYKALDDNLNRIRIGLHYLGVSNSFLNVGLYALRLPKFRSAVRGLWAFRSDPLGSDTNSSGLHS